MSFVYTGFDMVPQLTMSECDANAWSKFIADVVDKYEDDGPFSQELLFVEFDLGHNNSPKLPFQGQKFRRFCIGYQNKKNKIFKRAVPYVKGVFEIAKKHFGDQVQFWDEGEGQLGHYRWSEVEEVQSTYKDFTCGDKPLDQGDEGGPGYEPRDVIQKWIPPFVKVLLNDARLTRCNNCFKMSPHIAPCNKCKAISYCSAACRKLDMKKGHLYECESVYFRNRRCADVKIPSEMDMSFKVLRLISFLKQCPEKLTEPVEIYNGKYKSFKDILESVTVKEVGEQLGFTTYAMLLKMEFEKDPTFSPEDVKQDKLLQYLTLWSKLQMNIMDEDGINIIGQGIFIHTAFFKRADPPSAACIGLGPLIQVEAMKRIPRGVTPTIGTHE